ncbi:MAG: dUTP diphosphatase [Candidatus Kapaibacteriales bacterium]
MTIKIKKIRPDFDEIELPMYQSSGAAGMDLRAAIESPISIRPGGIMTIDTNIAIAVPMGYEAQIRSRSGLASKFGVFALNSPGTIDSDYRGEIRVILANFGNQRYTVQSGDRIAQMVVTKYETANWEITDELDDTDRGEGGFGSSGIG